MTGLVDQYGRPIKAKALTEDVAGPTLGSVRQVISDHPANGLTPGRLARIHREADEGEPLAYLELAEDIEERDLHYLGIMGTRKRSVAQLPITVKAASDDADHKKHAELIQSWIDDEVLRAALFDMLDAIGKGFSVLEIDWRYHGGHLCPREFIWRPQRWFTFDRTDGETVLLRETGGDEVLPAHKFLVHRHKAKSGLTIRSGLSRVASYAWMFKSFTSKDWAIFAQNYGQPIRVGRFGRGATEDEKGVLLRAVRNIAGDCAAIIPNDMQIEFVEVAAKGTSTDLYQSRVDWLDRQMSKAVLGQTTTTDAVSGGHAVAQEHRLVQEDIERADSLVTSSTINAQVIPNIIAMNFGPQDYYPKIKIGRPDEVPLVEFADAFEKIAPHGLTASLSFVRDRLGIPVPDDDAELVGGRQAAPDDNDARDPDADQKELQTSGLTGSLFNREDNDDAVEALRRRAQGDAAGALAGLSEEIRNVLLTAKTLREAADGLTALELDRDELATAMARGMALSNLAGQASLLDDMTGRR